jgi:hypothetical protein
MTGALPGDRLGLAKELVLHLVLATVQDLLSLARRLPPS